MTFFRTILSLFTCLLFLSPTLIGQDINSQKKKKDKILKEIELLDKQLQRDKDKESNTLNTIILINNKIDKRQKLIDENNREINNLAKEIELTNNTIQLLENRVDSMKIYYTKLLKKAYLNRNPKIWYLYIFTSNSINQAFRRYKYLNNISKQLYTETNKIKEEIQNLNFEKKSLNNLIEKSKALKIKNLEDLDKFNSEKEQQNLLVIALKKKQKSYVAQINAKRRDIEILNKNIEKLIKESMRRKKSSSKKEKKSKDIAIDYKLSKDFISNKANLPWPAQGTIIEYFGQNNHPIYKGVKLPKNNGISMILENGTIKSIFEGKVKAIVVVPGYNQCVLIQHGEYFSFYCKLSSVNVSVGDMVKTQQVIGAVVESNEQKQFHFEIWRGRKAENPLFWLSK